MSNQPDVEKKLIGIRISVETYYKLLRLAGGKRAKVHDVIRKILAAQVEDIELTESEREAILEEIRNNKTKQGRMK